MGLLFVRKEEIISSLFILLQWQHPVFGASWSCQCCSLNGEIYIWVDTTNSLLYVKFYLSSLLSKNPPHCLAVWAGHKPSIHLFTSLYGFFTWSEKHDVPLRKLAFLVIYILKDLSGMCEWGFLAPVKESRRSGLILAHYLLDSLSWSSVGSTTCQFSCLVQKQQRHDQATWYSQKDCRIDPQTQIL